MNHLGFESCKSDPYIWVRLAQKDYGSTYQEYVLLYVDEIFCIRQRDEHILRKNNRKYLNVKDGAVGQPTIYIGNKASTVTLKNGVA